MRSKLSLALFVLWLGVGVMRSATVTADEGNIVLTGNDGNKVVLTSTGLDTQPGLSPDGSLVTFVRATPARLIEAASGPEAANEIWVVESTSKQARRIVQGRANEDMNEVLTGLAYPAFAPDSRRIYFLSVAWVTSGAVHVIDLESGRVRFVAAGNSLEVVRTGKHAGCLVVQQHRYWLAGGSYDWYWLLDSSGQEVGPIGEEQGLANFRELYMKEAD